MKPWMLRIVVPIFLFSAWILSPEKPAARAQDGSFVFAVIGDYGMDNVAEAAVAALVAGWNPDLIITTGDDYYNAAGGNASAKYDESTGAYYCQFLWDIATSGTRCAQPGGAAGTNRFFPSLGNHDYSDAGVVNNLPQTYTDYFILPGSGYANTSGNERYYDFSAGPVHFFALNSNPGAGQEPDSVSSASIQAQWLRSQLAASAAPWNIVYFHHPPFSSGPHGSSAWMQWPFAAWGADAVFSGHDHAYERILRPGMVYFVNGAGGANLYPLVTRLPGSAIYYAANWGAQKVTVTADTLRVEFYSVENGGKLIDAYSIFKTRLAGSSDDAEQRQGDGAMYLDSTDLELVDDLAYWGEQSVGLRFANVNLPADAPVVSAEVEFRVDEITSQPASLVFYGQAALDPPAFSNAPYDLTSRPKTTAAETWTGVPAWSVIGERQFTPNLISILQEIVMQPGWVPGNSLVILVEGDGRRTAVAYDGDPSRAPLLRVGYIPGTVFGPRLYLPTIQR